MLHVTVVSSPLHSHGDRTILIGGLSALDAFI